MRGHYFLLGGAGGCLLLEVVEGVDRRLLISVVRKHATAGAQASGEALGVAVGLGLVRGAAGTGGEFDVVEGGARVEVRGVRAGGEVRVVGGGALHTLTSATIPPTLYNLIRSIPLPRPRPPLLRPTSPYRPPCLTV